MHTISVTVGNPLLRTPLGLIVDDSCPVLNLTHFWIPDRHGWKRRHTPSAAWTRGDGDLARMDRVPERIPADFARKWGEWCAENGVKGKFSLVPYPAGVARVDQGMGSYAGPEFEAWMQVYREIIAPNFDITCEMLTHTRVVDLKDWSLTEAWEQYEWVNPPVEPLTDYITTAMTLVRDAGVPCDGVTSPGAFGRDQEEAYARATLDAAQAVMGNPRPFYFLRVHVAPEQWPDIPIWHADKERGTAIASIIGCTDDWFGNWTGYDAGSADHFLTADLTGGALRPVLDRELPCVLVSHWPGMYFNGEEVGLNVLKEVKCRLDAYDPEGIRTRWMKTSEMGRYWMARQLNDITVDPMTGDGEGEQSAPGWQVVVAGNFPTPDFTLQAGAVCSRVTVNGADLRKVHSRRDFQTGTFLTENGTTALAFDLAVGQTTLQLFA